MKEYIMRYSGLAAQSSPPEELGATHSDPLRGRRNPVPRWAPLYSGDLRLQARAGLGRATWRMTPGLPCLSTHGANSISSPIPAPASGKTENWSRRRREHVFG